MIHGKKKPMKMGGAKKKMGGGMLYKKAAGGTMKKATQADMVKAMKAGGGVKLAKILAAKNNMKVVPKSYGGMVKKKKK